MTHVEFFSSLEKSYMDRLFLCCWSSSPEAQKRKKGGCTCYEPRVFLSPGFSWQYLWFWRSRAGAGEVQRMGFANQIQITLWWIIQFLVKWRCKLPLLYLRINSLEDISLLAFTRERAKEGKADKSHTIIHKHLPDKGLMNLIKLAKIGCLFCCCCCFWWMSLR